MKVVLDTNVLVAAGFEKESASARIVEAVRAGGVTLVWDEATAAETRHILAKIPPLNSDEFADLYRPQDRYAGVTRLDEMTEIEDPADRKFAALAVATGAVLVSNDDHLLGVRTRIDAEVVTPSEFVARYLDQ